MNTLKLHCNNFHGDLSFAGMDRFALNLHIKRENFDPIED